MTNRFLHRSINALWYGKNPLAYLLMPLSCLFQLLSSQRRRKQLTNQIVFTKPIIIVGNITVGGTGKTPMVSALVNKLQNYNYRVGVASRGYHGEIKQATLIKEEHTAQQVGDESLLIYRKTLAPVVIGADRMSVIKTLIEKHDCDVIVCDDGLQDYRFKHDVEIVMVDGDRVLGNQQLLPAGPLRESIERAHKADFIVTTSKAVPAISSDCMRLNIKEAIAMNNTGNVSSLSVWQGKMVHAIAGIANPQRFFSALKAKGLIVKEHEFPDHAKLDRTDVIFSDQKPVFMTEKDAVKCQHLNLQDAWYVPVHVELPSNFVNRVMARLNT